MEDILKNLGWGDGFCMPVANAENKALEIEIQKKQKEKDNLKSVVEDITERVSGIKKHLINVHHQHDQNQNLILAQNNQKEAEENLVKLSKIEDNSLSNDIKKIKKERKDVEDRQKIVQGDIFRVTEHIKKINAFINWDKEALLEWDEEVSRGDDDSVMLEKFRKEDEAKFKELELRRQTLSLELENKKNKLINLKNDVFSMEQSLDKTAQMFRRQHVDRRGLVQQWESSVRILYQRDEDINRIVEEVANLKHLAKDRLKDLEEQKTFLENEEKNNKELEKDIEGLNKRMGETKEKIKLIEEIINDENDKFATMKAVLVNTATAHHHEIIKNKNIIKEISEKNKQVKEMKVKIEKTKLEFDRFRNKTLSSVERIQELEGMLKDEDKICERNLAEFKKLDELMFQVTQQIIELKNAGMNQMSNIEHIAACNATVKKHITKAKTELNRQKEVLYNMDFVYMEKDILLSKMLGVVKDVDQEKHEKRISELEEIYSKVLAANTLLTKEVTHLEEDMRRVAIDLQGDSKEQNYLKNKRQENVLLVDCGEKQLKVLRAQNQDKQVEENLLKLRVKQAEKAIDKVGGKLFSLEKQRLELEEVMKERDIEIKTLRDILNVRRRVLLEQTANFNSKISLAKLKVEHLKNRYEVTVCKLGKDENGDPLSATHIKIKAAQEKFELQELGDKLDSKIKKTEKEIEAMENTLKVVNATNKAFRNNLQNIDPNSSEVLEKQEIERDRAKLLDQNRKKKAFLNSLNKLSIELEQNYKEKIKACDAALKLWKEKEEVSQEIERDIKDQQEKLERAEKQLKKRIKEVRGTHSPKFQTIEEKDIDLRELMEQNEYGLQQLAELVAKTYDTGPVVIQYLSEKGLSLPTIKSPSSSIKYASTTSLLSPGRSISSRSNESVTSKSSSCLITPSVVTLDSTKLSDDTRSDSSSRISSVKADKRKSS